MIIVLAGTSEGREITGLLLEAGWPVLASVTSEFGEVLLQKQGILNIVKGVLQKESLVALIKNNHVKFLVDATHPFAAAISRKAMEAAHDTRIEYLRLERKAGSLPDDPLVIPIRALEELEDHLSKGKRVFSTLGSKNIPIIMPIIRRKNAELIVRVLPSSTVLKSCEDLGLNPGQIIAMQGPFSRILNMELFKQYKAEIIISKDSGPAGGLDAKIEAAREMEIPILVWARPELSYPQVFHSSGSLLEYIKESRRC
jgi:precorrin-6A/cobalt-precorrin-6A reductase